MVYDGGGRQYCGVVWLAGWNDVKVIELHTAIVTTMNDNRKKLKLEKLLDLFNKEEGAGGREFCQFWYLLWCWGDCRDRYSQIGLLACKSSL